MNHPTHLVRFVLAALAASVLAFTAATPAWAGDVDPKFETLKADGATALLEEADHRSNAFDDQTITVEMTLEGGSNDGKTLQITTITKGALRAIRFEEPADMKGMGVVIKGRDEIYVRLPGAQKVRRVGSHAKRQGFQGTDWGFDDMAIVAFAADYTPTIAEETDTHVVMDLEGKSDDMAYPTLKVKVAKANLMVDWIEYHDEDGKPIKVQKRGKPKKLGGEYDIHTEVRMTTLDSGTTTVNRVKEEILDQGVKDSTFSRRWLIRGL